MGRPSKCAGEVVFVVARLQTPDCRGKRDSVGPFPVVRFHRFHVDSLRGSIDEERNRIKGGAETRRIRKRDRVRKDRRSITTVWSHRTIDKEIPRRLNDWSA